MKQRAWREAYALCATSSQQWAVIRQVYQDVMPHIHAASQYHLRGRINPSFVNWHFTPIEDAAWQTIRWLGTPLYPQVPVGPYFIDFASPSLRIGLELDGAAYHDPAKDTVRDENLMQRGWKIFRITGSESYASHVWTEDMEDLFHEGERGPAWDWLCHSSDGIITALDHVYFRHEPERWLFFELAVESLDRHRLAPFSLGAGPVMEAYDAI